MVLVGKKKFKSKDGKVVYCQLYATRPVSDFDLRYSLDCDGSMLETVWVSEQVYDKIIAKDFGKNMALVTEYVNGRNTVVDVKIS